MTARPSTYILIPGILLACAFLHAGCKSEGKASRVESLNGSTAGQTGPLSPLQLQGSLMAYADRYLARIEQATDAIVSASTDPRVRMLAQSAKYYPSLAVVTTAVDSDPDVALLDMLTVATLERAVWEAGRAQEEFGSLGADLLAAHSELEADAWHIAARVLDEGELTAMHALLDGWLAEHPNQRNVSMVRFDDFSHLRDNQLRSRSSVIKVNLVLADTSQAAAEVRRTRLFAERAMFLAGRMPLLTAWQVELLAYNLALAPEIRQALGNADTVSDSIRRMADEVNDLPQNLDSLIKDARDGLNQADAVAQRLTSVTEGMKEVAAETTDAANALNQMVQSADRLAARFGKPEGESTTAPDSRPFDVREYTQALTELTTAARELGTLMEHSNQMLASPAWEARVGEIDAALSRRIDHVDHVSMNWLDSLDARAQVLSDRLTVRGMWLIGIGCVAAVATALIIRFVTRPRGQTTRQ